MLVLCYELLWKGDSLGPGFSRYGRSQKLTSSMESNPEQWGKSPRISGWRAWGNRGGEVGKRNLMRRWCLLWYPHVWTKAPGQQGELSATASTDPLALAAPEFVDLHCLIQMLTVREEDVWRALSFEFLFCWFIQFRIFGSCEDQNCQCEMRTRKNNFFRAEVGKGESWALWDRKTQEKSSSNLNHDSLILL